MGTIGFTVFQYYQNININRARRYRTLRTARRPLLGRMMASCGIGSVSTSHATSDVYLDIIWQLCNRSIIISNNSLVLYIFLTSLSHPLLPRSPGIPFSNLLGSTYLLFTRPPGRLAFPETGLWQPAFSSKGKPSLEIVLEPSDRPPG